MHGDPGLSIPVTELRREYHPSLNGTYNGFRVTPHSLSAGRCCDRNGTFIPSNTPPEVLAEKADDDWSPFTSRAGFELADFMYADAQLSQRKIDKILELWAATLVPHGDSPPAVNHQDLHQQIDAIELGNIEWESAPLKYEGLLPRMTRIPEWKTTVYDVWYRDPRKVIKGILSSPDLDGHIDYMAYREFDDGQRRYSNVMSGDWVWQQSVRLPCVLDSSPIFLTPFLGYHRRRPINPWLHICSDYPGV